MKKSNKISAIVITLNEEKKIVGCLDTLNWTDEIIVVDTGSTDETVKKAKIHDATVIKYKKGGYSDWRNKGLKEAKGEWVLYVDADERVTDELKQEINKVIGNETSDLNAYAIPRRNFILGKEMKHCGGWPDYVKRLFKRRKLKKWIGELHEEPVFEGEMGHLNMPLVHIKHDNLTEMVEKTNIWSETEAKLMYEANHPPMNLPRFLSAMLREFWLRMVKQTAFLDGTEGIIYAIYQVYSRFISYTKLWELQNDLA